MKMRSTHYMVCAAAVAVSAGCKSGPKENWVAPAMKPVTEAVFASGHLEAQEQFTLTAFSDGYLKQSLVKEDDTVTKGQVLFVQDNTNPAIQQQAAAENLALTRRNASAEGPALQQLYASLSTAQEQLALNKTQLGRLQRLYTTRSVAKTEVDNAQLAYDNALNTVKRIEEEIGSTKLSLQQAVVNSRSQYESAAVNSGYLQLKSPGNYRVYQVIKKQGELLRKGDAVAVLGNKASLLVMLDIDESGIAKVKPGMLVLVQLNTEKGKTYTAHISRIYPAFDEKSQAYRAEAVFDSTAAGLIAGTLLQANVVVQEKTSALLIPRSCLSADGKVIVQREKRKDTIAVQTGIVSTEWVEVTGGLTTTDKVLQAF